MNRMKNSLLKLSLKMSTDFSLIPEELLRLKVGAIGLSKKENRCPYQTQRKCWISSKTDPLRLGQPTWKMKKPSLSTIKLPITNPSGEARRRKWSKKRRNPKLIKWLAPCITPWAQGFRLKTLLTNSRRQLSRLFMQKPRLVKWKLVLLETLISMEMTTLACVYRCTSLGLLWWYTGLSALKVVSGTRLTKDLSGYKLPPESLLL